MHAQANIFTKEQKDNYEHARLFDNFDTVVPEGRELTLENFIVLQGGTSGGRTSVMLRMKGSNGKEYVVQITGRIMEALFGIFKGSEMRFGASNTGAL